MALTERKEIGKIEIVGPFKHVQVREDTVIERDGVEISREYSRFVVSPGDDHTDLHPDVRAIVEVVHTDEINQAYKDHIESNQEI